MASLGANVTIPDQVVLVGGTGRHLSDRFSSFSSALLDQNGESRYGVRIPNPVLQKPNIQDRLGPPSRRYNDLDLDREDTMYSHPHAPGRQHVLKRLGQPTHTYGDRAYNWGQSYNSTSASSNNAIGSGYGGSGYGGSGYGDRSTGYDDRPRYTSYSSAPVGRGSSRGRRRPWYSYGGYRPIYNRYSYSNYSSPYNYYSNNYTPYSYYNYSKPRFGNWTKYYNNSYNNSFRGYGGGYGRGRYNSGGYNSSRYTSRSRRGGYGQHSSRSQVTQDDLDRELDEYRAGTSGTKDRSGDVSMA